MKTMIVYSIYFPCICKAIYSITILTVLRCPPTTVYCIGTSPVGGTWTQVLGNLTVAYWVVLLSSCEVTFSSSLWLSRVVISSDILSLDMPLSLHWEDMAVVVLENFPTCYWLHLVSDVILWQTVIGIFSYTKSEFLAPPYRGLIIYNTFNINTKKKIILYIV